MKNAEYIALNTWLADYPEEKKFEEILTDLMDADINIPEGYDFIEFHEDFYPPLIADYIEQLHDAIVRGG